MLGRDFARKGRWHKKGSSENPPPPASPVFVSVTEETPTSTSIYINWTMDKPCDGYIEYGTTQDYGLSTTFEPTLLSSHRQLISVLSAGTTYYYRIVSRDANGYGATYTGDFTTSGTVVITSSVFGIPVNGYNKNNLLVKSPASGDVGHGQAVGYRFMCTHTGTPLYLRHQWKAYVAGGYAGGDGGTYRVGIQTVNPVTRMPNDPATWLFYVDGWRPGITTSNGGFCVRQTFSGASQLTEGTIYALVWLNTDPNPDVNFGSTNQPSSHSKFTLTPVNPLWPDDETVTIYQGPSNWTQATNNWMAAFDLEYSDGEHEGFTWVTGVDVKDPGDTRDAYTSAEVGDLNSGSKCRLAFTYPTGQPTITVDAINLWMNKLTGTTNATVSVKKNSAEVATGTLTTSGAMAANTRSWQRAALSASVSIAAGDYIEAIFSTTAGSWYIPLALFRDYLCTTPPAAMASYPYSLSADGTSQPFRSYDGSSGTTAVWSPWAAHSSFQCYFEII